MKENKYDDTLFYEKYSLMSRSLNGLDGAGEWNTLKASPDRDAKQQTSRASGDHRSVLTMVTRTA